jgi:hypothetical protein
MKMLMTALLIVSQLLACAPPAVRENSDQAAPQAADVPASRPAAQPATQPAAPPVAIDAPAAGPTVDELLNKLESGAADLVAFAARITYEKFDETLGRKEIRIGEIIYQRDAETNQKRFAALFDAVITGNQRRERLKHYIFDGRWLAEVDHESKQFIKREIVPPGKSLDPLKLGEGPFPLPIGQPKKDVLERFDVTRAELPAEGLLKDLKETDGLLLVPKPGTAEARDFTKVTLFYDRATMLPVGIMTLETNGDRKTIRLTDAKRNPALDDAALKKLDIRDPDPHDGWGIDVQAWKAQ